MLVIHWKSGNQGYRFRGLPWCASKPLVRLRHFLTTMPEMFRRALAFERAFVKAGGVLGAGVDPTGMGDVLPG